jgi:hypothetical protein
MKDQSNIKISTAGDECVECIDNHGKKNGTEADHGRPDYGVHPAANIGKEKKTYYPNRSKSDADDKKDKNYCVNRRVAHTSSPFLDLIIAIVPA